MRHRYAFSASKLHNARLEWYCTTNSDGPNSRRLSFPLMHQCSFIIYSFKQSQGRRTNSSILHLPAITLPDLRFVYICISKSQARAQYSWLLATIHHRFVMIQCNNSKWDYWRDCQRAPVSIAAGWPSKFKTFLSMTLHERRNLSPPTQRQLNSLRPPQWFQRFAKLATAVSWRSVLWSCTCSSFPSFSVLLKHVTWKCVGYQPIHHNYQMYVTFESLIYLLPREVWYPTLYRIKDQLKKY